MEYIKRFNTIGKFTKNVFAKFLNIERVESTFCLFQQYMLKNCFLEYLAISWRILWRSSLFIFYIVTPSGILHRCRRLWLTRWLYRKPDCINDIFFKHKLLIIVIGYFNILRINWCLTT